MIREKLLKPYHWFRRKVSGEIMRRITGSTYIAYSFDDSKVDYKMALLDYL